MNKGYKILLIASLISGFADNLVGSFYAVFVRGIGGDVLDIGYSVTLYSILTGVLIIWIGKLSDRINSAKITTLGFVLFAIGSFGYIFISAPYQLFILQVIFAIGTACLSAPLSALFAKYINKENAGLQWALDSGGQKIITGVSVFVGTFIISSFGFKILFLVMGTLQLLSALIQMTLQKKE
ncbi:MAG: hypothetical protein QG583_759 [Patescibacteria group bacterium]|nr:hypothetical protein [Patescibacteria group bacterium]